MKSLKSMIKEATLATALFFSPILAQTPSSIESDFNVQIKGAFSKKELTEYNNMFNDIKEKVSWTSRSDINTVLKKEKTILTNDDVEKLNEQYSDFYKIMNGMQSSNDECINGIYSELENIGISKLEKSSLNPQLENISKFNENIINLSEVEEFKKESVIGELFGSIIGADQVTLGRAEPNYKGDDIIFLNPLDVYLENYTIEKFKETFIHEMAGHILTLGISNEELKGKLFNNFQEINNSIYKSIYKRDNKITDEDFGYVSSYANYYTFMSKYIKEKQELNINMSTNMLMPMVEDLGGVSNMVEQLDKDTIKKLDITCLQGVIDNIHQLNDISRILSKQTIYVSNKLYNKSIKNNSIEDIAETMTYMLTENWDKFKDPFTQKKAYSLVNFLEETYGKDNVNINLPFKDPEISKIVMNNY